ncbi:hypothetical protein [Sphingomonas montana]|uniref:hypothetical protein n=1 Tax=Sphingomonas montana TaxID=1843236 RepID=UPI00096BDA34|nr:hypothetical protein [Sphingomonas montana]
MFGCGFDPFDPDVGIPVPVMPRHPATVALLARMTTPPAPSRAAAIDRLIVGLHVAGIWDRLEALYVPAAHHPQAALLDWTGRHGTAAVAGGSPTFVADRGCHVDGIDDWIDLGFGPAQGQRFQQNSAMVAMWVRNANTGQTASGFGLLGSNQTGLNPRGAGGVPASRLNSSAATVGASVPTGHGLIAVDRAGATAVQHYKNGLANGIVGTAASSTPASANFVMGRAGGSHAANQFCAVAIGGHLTAAEHGGLHAALDGYMTAVGVTELAIGGTTRTLAAARTLPDGGSGAAAGKGWTCTGLARLPDGSWLVGNDGRGSSASDPNLASIVHLSADMTTILHQWTTAAMGFSAGSVQGVAWEPLAPGQGRGRIWFMIVGAGQPLCHATLSEDWSITATGTLAGVTSGNGVVHDAIRDRIVVLNGSTLTWRDKDTGAPTGLSATVHVTEPDHLCHDVASDTMLVSFGANGQPGGVARLSMAAVADYGAPAVTAIDTLPGCDAIEGIAIAGDAWTLCNDAYFHPGTPALNRLLTFTA